MATLTHLASRYRWELMLVIGIPIIERTILWLLPHILGNFNLSLDYWSCPPDNYCFPRFVFPFLNISLYLLAFFYFHVRRTGRTTLTLLWAFAFVREAVESATILLLAVDYLVQWSATGISETDSKWYIGLTFLPVTMVLVWFARQASKISFRHALVLIGLANSLSWFGLWLPNVVFTLLEDRMVYWDIAASTLAGILFTLWVLLRLEVAREKHETNIERWIGSCDIPIMGTVLRSLAIRISPHFDPARGISQGLLVALYGLNWLSIIYLILRDWVVDGFIPVFPTAFQVFQILYFPVLILIFVLLAYAVRIRNPPEPPSSVEPKASA